MLNVVVLPAPFGPRSAKIVSVPTLKLTPSTTRPLPNDLETSMTRSASSASPLASASLCAP